MGVKKEKEKETIANLGSKPSSLFFSFLFFFPFKINAIGMKLATQ